MFQTATLDQILNLGLSGLLFRVCKKTRLEHIHELVSQLGLTPHEFFLY